jgi:hypothetical protein
LKNTALEFQQRVNFAHRPGTDKTGKNYFQINTKYGSKTGGGIWVKAIVSIYRIGRRLEEELSRETVTVAEYAERTETRRN